MLLYDLQMRPHHFLLLGGVSTYGLLEHNGIGLPRVTKSIAAKELVKIIVYVPSTDKLSKCHHSIDNDFTLKSSTMYISNELNRDHCFFKNGPFPASFSLFSSFQYTVDSKQLFNI